LPSVGLFVECLLSGTRQSQALGNELIYRAQDTRHRTTLGKDIFAECLTLGKEGARQTAVSGRPKADDRQPLPRAEDWHSTKGLLCQVPNTGHSAKNSLSSVGLGTFKPKPNYRTEILKTDPKFRFFGVRCRFRFPFPRTSVLGDGLGFRLTPNRNTTHQACSVPPFYR
jgi:hypothetical protein